MIQMQQAQKHFLTYDQQAIIQKCRLSHDADFLYVRLFSEAYRLSRKTGALELRQRDRWVDANRFGPVMTILDVLCDCREDRHLSGQIQTQQAFGQQFHSKLLEPDRDPLAERFDKNPALFVEACTALGGRPAPGADLAFAIPMLDDLEIHLQFWHADEDFPAQLQYFWDKNALQYIKYETMYYALGLLKDLLSREAVIQ